MLDDDSLRLRAAEVLEPIYTLRNDTRALERVSELFATYLADVHERGRCARWIDRHATDRVSLLRGGGRMTVMVGHAVEDGWHRELLHPMVRRGRDIHDAPHAHSAFRI